jgi:hypothetical protein
MSAWKNLGPGWADALEGSAVEDEMGVDLLIALGMEARLRDAARMLAEEEHQLGTHVDENEPLVRSMRLAADDRTAPDTARVYTGGKLKVSVRVDGTDLVFTQVSGPRGITVVLGEVIVPLQIGVEARADGISTLPDTLVVLDRKGRRRTLAPQD